MGWFQARVSSICAGLFGDRWWFFSFCLSRNRSSPANRDCEAYEDSEVIVNCRGDESQSRDFAISDVTDTDSGMAGTDNVSCSGSISPDTNQTADSLCCEANSSTTELNQSFPVVERAKQNAVPSDIVLIDGVNKLLSQVYHGTADERGSSTVYLDIDDVSICTPVYEQKHPPDRTKIVSNNNVDVTDELAKQFSSFAMEPPIYFEDNTKNEVEANECKHDDVEMVSIIISNELDESYYCQQQLTENIAQFSSQSHQPDCSKTIGDQMQYKEYSSDDVCEQKRDFEEPQPTSDNQSQLHNQTSASSESLSYLQATNDNHTSSANASEVIETSINELSSEYVALQLHHLDHNYAVDSITNGEEQHWEQTNELDDSVTHDNSANPVAKTEFEVDKSEFAVPVVCQPESSEVVIGITDDNSVIINGLESGEGHESMSLDNDCDRIDTFELLHTPDFASNEVIDAWEKQFDVDDCELFQDFDAPPKSPTSANFLDSFSDGSYDWFEDFDPTAAKPVSSFQRDVVKSPPPYNAVSDHRAAEKALTAMQPSFNNVSLSFPTFSVIPMTTDDVKPLVDSAIEVCWQCRRYGEPLDSLLPPPSYFEPEDLLDSLESTSIRNFKKLVFDLVAEILHDIYHEEDHEEPVPWSGPPLVKTRRFPTGCDKTPTTVDAIRPIIYSHVLRCMGLTSDNRTLMKSKKWLLGRKVNNVVDHMLVEELSVEESEWVHYEHDVTTRKVQIADFLVDALIFDTTQALINIQRQRHNHG